MTLNRQAVYCALDTERMYQQRRYGIRNVSKYSGDTTFEEKETSLDDFLDYIKLYADQLKKIADMRRGGASFPDDSKNITAVVRKVTALGIACMEQHGVDQREYKPTTNVNDNLPA